jgi:hypothetical protein
MLLFEVGASAEYGCQRVEGNNEGAKLDAIEGRKWEKKREGKGKF